MNIQSPAMTQDEAALALREYKSHRSIYDNRDWEIERIYRAIAKGKKVISVKDAIVNAGQDTEGRPRLAICPAHAYSCVCLIRYDQSVDFGIAPTGVGRIRVPWPGITWRGNNRYVAELPRIPPQFRPSANTLAHYHVLWEADWKDIPRDPYLLKKIGRDAWVILAAWELTEVELSVMRAYRHAV